MAFIPVPNGMRIALEQRLDDQQVVNVFYCLQPTGVTVADLTAIAGIFKDWWINELSPVLSQDISLERVVATDVSVEGGNQVTDTGGLPDTGDVATEAMSNNVALCVTRYTLFTGRSRRGRSYVAGLHTASITNNTVLTSPLAVIVTAFGQLSLNIQAGGYVFVVASFQSGGVPRVTADVRGVASFAANSRVDTQRRRLPGEGS